MKKLLIIGAIIFAAGALIFTGALAAADWDVTVLSTVPEYEVKTYIADRNDLDITVNNSNTTIRLGRSEDGRVHLEYYDNAKQYYTITESDSLTVERVDTYEWYERLFLIDFETPTLTLLLPENYGGSLHITNDNGSFTAENVHIAGTFYHKTSNGNITLKNLSAQSVEVKSSNGNITLKELETQSVELKTSNGDITVSGSKIASMLKATTSNGDVRTTANTLGGSATLKTSNGNVTVTDDIVPQRLDARTSNGNITVNAVDSSDIYLKTSNGDIKGSVAGSMNDYMIVSRTSNGHNNLPGNKSDGQRRLEVRTSNGDIKISFTNRSLL